MGAGMSARAAPQSAIWVESVEVVDSWARRAKAGDDLIYAHGPDLPRIAGTLRVQQLVGRGIVHPYCRRADGGVDFIARLLRQVPPTRGDAFLGGDARAVLDYLRCNVRPGQSMPTGAAIAMDLGLRSEGQANNLLHRLKRLGLIDWRLASGRNHEPARRVLARMGAIA